MEIVVCMLLICSSVLLILGLLPSSIVALRHAEQVQDASMYGGLALEEMKENLDLYSPQYLQGLPPTFTTTWHNHDYTVSRDVRFYQDVLNPVPSPTPVEQTYLLGVTITWPGQSVPVHMATYYAWNSSLLNAPKPSPTPTPSPSP